jgi:hypothetical protein
MQYDVHSVRAWDYRRSGSAWLTVAWSLVRAVAQAPRRGVG